MDLIVLFCGRRDTRYNDSQRNDTQHINEKGSNQFNISVMLKVAI